MSFEMDSGAGNGSKGPWISWKSQRQAFEHRDMDNNKTQFDGFVRGVVVDIETMKTGWCYSAGMPGVAPEWRWNASIKRMEQKPEQKDPANDWKRGFSIRCAISGTEAVTWEDMSAGAWNGFTDMIPDISAGSRANPNKLPVLQYTGCESVKFGRGSANIPRFQIVKWVDRPQALMDADDGGFMDAGAASPAEQMGAADNGHAPSGYSTNSRGVTKPSASAINAANAAQAPAGDPFAGGDEIPF